MKNRRFFFAVMTLGALYLSACEYDAFDSEGALKNVTTSSAFIRFPTSTPSPIKVTENSGMTSVKLEFIFPLIADIDVNYSFSGSAQWGVDYEVPDANASGGSSRIVHNPDDTNFGSNTIQIALLKDGVADGPKELIITLDSASSSSGSPISAGQGNLHNKVTFNIADID